jgi:aryl-alcohol dehydrogenase-like predicted oxidoreductase
MVGKWLKRTGKRDQIFLASKYGFVKGSPTYAVDSSAEYTRKTCEESLRLLGVESVDLCKLSFFLYHSKGETRTVWLSVL